MLTQAIKDARVTRTETECAGHSAPTFTIIADSAPLPPPPPALSDGKNQACDGAEGVEHVGDVELFLEKAAQPRLSQSYDVSTVNEKELDSDSDFEELVLLDYWWNEALPSHPVLPSMTTVTY